MDRSVWLHIWKNYFVFWVFGVFCSWVSTFAARTLLVWSLQRFWRDLRLRYLQKRFILREQDFERNERDFCFGLLWFWNLNNFKCFFCDEVICHFLDNWYRCFVEQRKLEKHEKENHSERKSSEVFGALCSYFGNQVVNLLQIL